MNVTERVPVRVVSFKVPEKVIDPLIPHGTVVWTTTLAVESRVVVTRFRASRR